MRVDQDDERVSSGEPDSQMRQTGRSGREMREGREGTAARRERGGSVGSQRRRGSEIDRTHSLSMDSADGHDATEEESSDEDGDGGYNQNLESMCFQCSRVKTILIIISPLQVGISPFPLTPSHQVFYQNCVCLHESCDAVYERAKQKI